VAGRSPRAVPADVDRRADAGRPLRVALVTWRLARSAGVPRFGRDLVAALGERVRFTVLTLQEPAISTAELAAIDAALARSVEVRALHPPVASGTRAIRAGHELRRQWRNLRMIRGLDADVLHVIEGTWTSVALAVLCRRRSTILSRFEPLATRPGERAVRAERWLAHLVRTVVASPAIGEALTAETRAFPPKIGLIRLGAMFETPLQRTAARAELGCPPGAHLVVSVGRVLPAKRPEMFVDVAARVRQSHPDALFLWVGTGTRLAACRKLLSDAGATDFVRFDGWLPRIAPALAAADVYLSTSVREGFGLAVLEAQHAGLAVVAADAIALRDLVLDGTTGRLAPVDDVVALADAVSALLDDPAGAARMGAAGRRRQRALFTADAMAEGYLNEYARLARRRRRDRARRPARRDVLRLLTAVSSARGRAPAPVRRSRPPGRRP